MRWQEGPCSSARNQLSRAARPFVRPSTTSTPATLRGTEPTGDAVEHLYKDDVHAGFGVQGRIPSLKKRKFGAAERGESLYVAGTTGPLVDDTVKGGGGDPFGALDAMRFITYLTIGYMIARGLAKAGSRDAYDA